ncbi:homocitrate synthase [Fibrobacteres bacterium R8-0-B4]
MIRITDRTLSCLDWPPPPDVSTLSRFLSLLTELDPGAIELSEAMYQLLSPLPAYPSYVLRLSKAADAAKYPAIVEFVCPEEALPAVNAKVRAEILLDDVDGAGIDSTAKHCRDRAVDAKLRAVCPDSAIINTDYQQIFARLKHRSVEFCPTNRFHCATALAAEWAMSGAGAGDGVVTTFGGLGGFAATEELIIILRVNNLIDTGKSYGFLPEMAKLFRTIAKKNVPPNKPVIGKRIFRVESGIHVDGILKQPVCYEPFPPEIVGQTRKIVLGRQSGVASVRAKLSELKLRCDEEKIPFILAGIKAKAAEKRGAVTDREFSSIVKSIHSDNIAPRRGAKLGRNSNPNITRTPLGVRSSVHSAIMSETLNINNTRRYLVDSTLRDGGQTPGIFFSPNQKLKIAALLDSGGVHQIEAGVPAASSEEKATIVNIIKNRKKAVISVWARLVPADIEHAIDVRPDLIHVCVPVSQTQIREKLRTDKESVVNKLRECLQIVKKSGIPLSVGFEDAFRADIDFMILITQILLDSSVTRIRLSDTVGIASPSQCRTLLKKIITESNNKAELGIHAHNDLGMAVANTIEAAKSGCLYADVTAGGIGERAGNCGLADLVRASSSIFDWGMTAEAARELQKEIKRII